MFLVNNQYSRQEVWEYLFPEEKYLKGGDWSTGYSAKNGYFVIFANIQSAGKSGHSYPNKIHKNGLLEWYGKGNAHSAQKNLNALFEGRLKPLVFIRYDNSTPKFYYYGSPNIKDFKDNCSIEIEINNSPKMIETINVNFLPTGANIPGIVEAKEEAEIIGVEGAKIQVYVNRYERDPSLRKKCIDLHGSVCRACGFSFEETYGELGKGFCHVHHKKPLSELEGQTAEINPETDLIPLCANCHAIIHRTSPALSLGELKKILSIRKG